MEGLTYVEVLVMVVWVDSPYGAVNTGKVMGPMSLANVSNEKALSDGVKSSGAGPRLLMSCMMGRAE